MGRGAWRATVHGVTQSQTRLKRLSGSSINSGLPGGSEVKNPPAKPETRVLLGWEDPLEEEMATHSSILDWEIPWTEKPGNLLSMGLQRVGHN